MNDDPDTRHDAILKVTVLDTVTGKTHVDGRASTWSWTEGNWSCDCNRCPRDVELDDEQTKSNENWVCIGSKRFLAVAAEPLLDGYTLYDFNENYPDELVDKHLPGVRDATV